MKVPYQFEDETVPDMPSVLPAPKDATTRFRAVMKEPQMTGIMKAVIALVFINGLLLGAMVVLIISYITKP